MTLLSLIITLVIVGLFAWLALQLPVPQIIKNIIVVLLAVYTLIWLLQSLGLATDLPRVRLW